MSQVSDSHTAQEAETPNATSPAEVTDTSQVSETSTIPDSSATSPTPDLSATLTLSPTLRVELTETGVPTATIKISGEFVPDEVLIRFRRNAEQTGIDQCIQRANASIESEIEDVVVYRLKVPKGQVADSLGVLLSCPETRFAEPNYIAHIADTIPSDPGLGLQYGLVRIRAPQGWDLSTGSSAVTIAIVDTGVDLGHPDLSAKIVGGFDFVNNDNNPQDDNGHGTHVAGIAAAITNNGSGVAGVSWGALIMPIKVLNAGGNGTFADVAAGITWATDHGAQVINMSLGGLSDSAVLQSAVDYAYGKGVVEVAAAGNTGSNFVLFPAQYPHVIAVAATDNTNTRAAFSNFGPEMALSAPGVSIYSTLPGGSYGFLSGTSMSAPYVSGLAAILRGIPGIGSPDVIAFDMENTALDLGPSGIDTLYGYGLIQMDRAIRLASPLTATPQAAIPPRSTGQGQGSFITFTPGISFNTPTFTPSPTILPSETSTFLTTTPSTSETAEVSAQGNVTPTLSIQPTGASKNRPTPLSKLGKDWPIGCWGILLILLGVLLVWIIKRRQAHPHKQYFRFR